MKGFLGFCLAVLVFYSIYYDLQYGTIPNTTKAATLSTHMKKSKKTTHPVKIHIPYQKVLVRPGATVLSVVEHINGQSTVSIEKIVSDFKSLNPGVNPNEIKIGRTYLFPVYKQNQ